MLRGNCSADGQQTPFLPFIEVVRQGFSVSSGESDHAIAGKLDEGLKRLSCWSPQNRGLLLNLLGLEIPDDALAELDGTLVGARTRDLLLRLVEEQSRFSTVMLLLEDLHWIDSASEDLLLRIVGHEPALPLIILHTRRPEYHPPWAGRPGVAELRLAPLSSSETLRIAQIRFGVDKLPETLARLIVDKAEGNALFVEEIARYLIERGTVRHTPGGARLRPRHGRRRVAGQRPAAVDGARRSPVPGRSQAAPDRRDHRAALRSPVARRNRHRLEPCRRPADGDGTPRSGAAGRQVRRFRVQARSGARRALRQPAEFTAFRTSSQGGQRDRTSWRHPPQRGRRNACLPFLAVGAA